MPFLYLRNKSEPFSYRCITISNTRPSEHCSQTKIVYSRNNHSSVSQICLLVATYYLCWMLSATNPILSPNGYNKIVLTWQGTVAKTSIIIAEIGKNLFRSLVHCNLIFQYSSALSGDIRGSFC